MAPERADRDYAVGSSADIGFTSARPSLDAIRPAADTTNDRWAWNVYDRAQRLIETIDGAGSVTLNSYDGASQLISTTQRANRVDGTTLTATLSPGANTVAMIARSRRLSGTLDDLVRRGTASRTLATFLQQCLLARLNILIVGPRDGGVEQLLGAFAASFAEPEVVYAGNLAADRPGAAASEAGSLDALICREPGRTRRAFAPAPDGR